MGPTDPCPAGRGTVKWGPREQHYSKHGAQASSTCSTWEVVRNAALQTPEQTSDSDPQGVEPKNLNFNKPYLLLMHVKAGDLLLQ